MGPMTPLIFFAVVFWSVVLGTAIYAVRRLLRIMERRGGADAELTALQGRVAALEGALEDVRGSIDRLDASQEFTTKLLTARAARGDHAPD